MQKQEIKDLLKGNKKGRSKERLKKIRKNKQKIKNKGKVYQCNKPIKRLEKTMVNFNKCNK